MMAQNAGQILRKNQVTFTGTCRVDANPARLAASVTGNHSAACQPQVRIVDKNEQGAVLEFTCSCGSKAYIQCDYAGS